MMQPKVKPNESRYCALYIRVSTTDQGERYSPITQEKSLRAKAEREGFLVKDEYIFRDKFSGKQESRPAFDKMKALVRSGAVGAVFILCVDRLARKVVDALHLANEWRKHGVKLDFVETPYEDTPFGRFTFTQMAAVAELIGEKIVEDSKRGRRERLEQGKPSHGMAKYGYVYIDKRQRDGGRFEIHPERAKVVRQIFLWRRNEKLTLYGIAKRLNSLGILSAGYNGKPGGRWAPPVIHKLLCSTTYIGLHKCDGFTLPVPRIVDDELFAAVQKSFSETRHAKVGRPSNKYLLRTFLWCAKCGRRCITSPARGYASYRCGNIDYTPYRRLCDAPQVLVRSIEREAWSAVWTLLKKPSLLFRLGQAYYDSIGKPESQALAKREQEAKHLRATEQTTIQMMKDQIIPYAQGLADVRAIKKQIAEIETELRAAGRVAAMPSKTATERALREITAGAEPETYEERRPILEAIEDLRMTYLDGDLEISGKVVVPMESTGSSQKNYNRSISTADNSFGVIPFTLNMRVA